jgi:hypothetical protein
MFTVRLKILYRKLRVKMKLTGDNEESAVPKKNAAYTKKYSFYEKITNNQYEKNENGLQKKQITSSAGQ